eukprot:Lankesteria_metandrocarpae@DN4729_c0_g1_i1.p2
MPDLSLVRDIWCFEHECWVFLLGRDRRGGGRLLCIYKYFGIQAPQLTKREGDFSKSGLDSWLRNHGGRTTIQGVDSLSGAEIQSDWKVDSLKPESSDADFDSLDEITTEYYFDSKKTFDFAKWHLELACQLSKPRNCTCLLGFVRFLGGYYAVVVESATRVATLANRSVYTPEVVSAVCCFDVEEFNRTMFEGYSLQQHEERYLETFMSAFDDPLKRLYFFAFGWDITKRLQDQLSPHTHGAAASTKQVATVSDKTRNGSSSTDVSSTCAESDVLSPKLTRAVTTAFNWQRSAETEFAFNAFMLRPLLGCTRVEARCWTIPIIQGSVAQQEFVYSDRRWQLTVIGRRSRFNVGPRYFKRGTDLNSNVANAVECEQLLWPLGGVDAGVTVASFTMFRGSVPLLWGHDEGLTPRPNIHLLTAPSLRTVIAKSHFEWLAQRYGSRVVVLNLIRQEGPKESELCRAFEDLVVDCQSVFESANQPIAVNSHEPNQMYAIKIGDGDVVKDKPKIGITLSYMAYDWLDEEGRLGFDAALRQLFEWSEGIVNCTGYDILSLIEASKGWRFDATRCAQRGISRVNCVDCLDRTNLAMFAIGQCAIRKQISHLLSQSQSTSVNWSPNASNDIDLSTEALSIIANIWGDVGDHLSFGYAGSEALHRATIKSATDNKGWFAEKRSNVMIAVNRYFHNLTLDTHKQRGFMLLLGDFVPSRKLARQRNLFDLEVFENSAARAELVSKSPLLQSPRADEEDGEGVSTSRIIISVPERIPTFCDLSHAVATCAGWCSAGVARSSLSSKDEIYIPSVTSGVPLLRRETMTP